MNNYPLHLKERLFSLIDDMASVSWLYCMNPGRDFTRFKKISFSDTMKFILAMEGSTVDKELVDYFLARDPDPSRCPSQSAFNQRRSHIKYEAFQQLFLDFSSCCPRNSSFDQYQILAVDGSNVVYATDPDNVDDYVTYETRNGYNYNQLHLDAFFDILNGIFVDAVVQHGVKYDERKAMHDMIDHFETPDPSHTIITADRGYESYDLIAHLREKGLRFVLRAKDYTTPSSLLAFYKEEYPDSPEFDVTIKRFISNSKDREILDNPSIYKYVKPAKDLPHIKFREESGLYYLQFRVVRIEIREGVYECLITNLPAWEFPKEKLKEIYHLRWGIETAFCQLKYSVSMAAFHAKKVEYIKQEIYARLILFNFSKSVSSHASVSKNKRKKYKHAYKINFNMAVHICRLFLKRSCDMHPLDVIGWIQQYLRVEKEPGRSFLRNLRGIGAVSFFYRLS